MGDSGLLIDHRIRDELGERLEDVLESLWPVACQTCRRPLGGGLHTLAVEQFGVLATATLHHPSCRDSRWVRRAQMPTSTPATLVQRTGSFLAPGPHADQRAARAVMLLNPGLEQVLLIREAPVGRWKVTLNRGFDAAGMVSTPRLDLDKPIAGAIAVLRSHSVAIVFDPPGVGPYETDLDDHTRQLVHERGGLLLAVTHALDPRQVGELAAVEPVLTGDRSLMGWIELESVRRARPASEPPLHGVSVMLHWSQQELWVAKVIAQTSAAEATAAQRWADDLLGTADTSTWSPVTPGEATGWFSCDQAPNNDFLLGRCLDGWRLLHTYSRTRSMPVLSESEARAWAYGQLRQRLGPVKPRWRDGSSVNGAISLYADI